MASLSALNAKQREAALHRDGPLAIYAGAGSGKTRVIVHRIAHLIEEGVPSSSILALTFTNKAAREMRERLQNLVGYPARNVLVSTFHAACARFLRVYATHIGYSANFSIADDGDQKALLKRIVSDLRIPESRASVQTFRGKIDRLKNKGWDPAAYAQHLAEQAPGIYSEAQGSFTRFGEDVDPGLILKVYQRYEDELKAADSMDFNDLLLKMVRLLKESSTTTQQMQNRFRYFLIDEFQDTNPIQFEWVQLLSSHTHNVCIVGDDDQSIYSWRGAEPKFIMEFQKFYPLATVVKLEQNYRSTGNIIQGASALISHNAVRAPKTLWTAAPQGEKIRVVKRQDNHSEAAWIADEMLQLSSSGVSYGDFAVLYRTNAQSRVLEDELRRRMLPYIIYGSVRFYERAEIKLLLTYLRLLVNFKDNLAFEKCVNAPKRGFGDKALSDLHEVAARHGLCLSQAAARIAYGEIESPFTRGLNGLKKFVELYTRLKIKIDAGEPAPEVLKLLLAETDFENHLRVNYPEDFDERWLNVVELQNALAEFTEEHTSQTELPEAPHPLAAFLESAALTVEPQKQNVESGSDDAITLMTIHSAKGLEYNRVYVAGLEEGTIPHMNARDTPADVEEERRLLYVAMTRARTHLTLVRVARHRFRRDMYTQKSRFLDEVPAEICEEIREGETHLSQAWAQHKYRQEPKGRGSQAQWGTEHETSWSSQGDRPARHKKITQSDRERAAPALKRLQDMVRSADDLAHPDQDDGRSPFQPGVRVRHKVFGIGTVKTCEKSVGAYRLEVRFPQAGTKRLMHTYVSLIDEEKPAPV
jgi:DNA helicase-2/ATP-dependent DNA helicase PcrA